MFGETCFFLHSDEATAERLAEEARIAANKGVKKNRGPGKRNRIVNDGRASVFRKFLLDTFGPALLQRGTVLDVAGGKGVLGFELANLNGVRCLVVDPRAPPSFAKLEKKWRWGLYGRNPVWAQYNPGFDAARDPEPPEYVRAFFDHGLIRWLHTAEPEYWDLRFGEASRYSWSRQGLRAEHGPAEESDDEDGDQVARAWSAEEIAAELRATTLVVGMHPDQATEPIVDFALARGVAFAVVPCCVYPAEFPKRKLDGSPVTTYEDFLRYLEQKDPRIRRQNLDFEGRNVALYYLPDAEPAAQEAQQ